MATEHNIQATGRNVEGKGASRRLRRSASIPAIVYGGTSAPQAIQLDHEKIWLASQHEWFYSSILNLDVDGKVQQVLLRDMQRHPFKQIIMHLDFQRVSADQALRAKVPLHFLNEDSSPAGKTAGVLVLHELNEIEVSCLPKDLPEFVEVDLSGLDMNQMLYLADLKVPEGVEIPELAHGRNAPIVSIHHARAEEVETPAAEAAGAAPAAAAAAPAAAAPAAEAKGKEAKK